MRRLKSVASFRGPSTASNNQGNGDSERSLQGIHNIPPACDAHHLLPLPETDGSPAYPPLAPRITGATSIHSHDSEPTTLMFKIDPDVCANFSVVHILPTFLFTEAVSEQRHSEYLRELNKQKDSSSSTQRVQSSSSSSAGRRLSTSGCSSTLLPHHFSTVMPTLTIPYVSANSFPVITSSRLGLKTELMKQLLKQLSQCYFCWLVDCSSTASVTSSIADLCDALDPSTITSRFSTDSQAALLASYCEQQRLRSRCCVFVLLDATSEMAAYVVRKYCPAWGAHILCVPPSSCNRTAFTEGLPWQVRTQQDALQEYHTTLKEVITNIDVMDIPIGVKDEVELFSNVLTPISEKMRNICENTWLHRLITSAMPPDFPPLDQTWILKIAGEVEYSPLYLRILAFLMIENGIEAYDLHQLFLQKQIEVKNRMVDRDEGVIMQTTSDQASESRCRTKRVAVAAIIRMLEHTLQPNDLPWARMIAVLPRHFPTAMFPTAAVPNEGEETNISPLLVHLGIISCSPTSTSNVAGGGQTASRTYWAAASFQQAYLCELTDLERREACALFHERVCVLNDRFPSTFYDDQLDLHDYLVAVESSQRTGVPVPLSVLVPAAYASTTASGDHTTATATRDSSPLQTPHTNNGSFDVRAVGGGSPKSARTHLGETESVGRRGSLGLGYIGADSTKVGGGGGGGGMGKRSGSVHSDIVDGGDILFETRGGRSRRVSLSLSAAAGNSDPASEMYTWKRWGSAVKTHLLDLTTKLNIPVLDVGSAVPPERCRTFNDLVTLPPVPDSDSLLTPELAALFQSYSTLYLHRDEPIAAASALERALCIYLHHFTIISADIERKLIRSGPSESVASQKRKAAAANAAGSFRMFGSFRNKPSTSVQENGSHSFLFAMLLVAIHKTYLDLAHCYHAAKMTGMAAPFIERANSVLQLLNGGRRDTPARTASLLPKAILEQYLAAMEVQRGFGIKESSADIDRGTVEKDVALKETIQSEVNEGHYARNAKNMAEEALRALTFCDEKLAGRIRSECYRHIAVGFVYTDQDSHAADHAQKASESYLACTRDLPKNLKSLTAAPPTAHTAVRATGSTIYPRPAAISTPSLADRQREIAWVRSMLPTFYTALETGDYSQVNSLLDHSILFSHCGLLPSAPDVPIIVNGTDLTTQLLKTEFPAPTPHPHLQLNLGFTDLEVARHHGNDWRKTPSQYLLPVHTLLLHYPRYEAPQTDKYNSSNTSQTPPQQQLVQIQPPSSNLGSTMDNFNVTQLVLGEAAVEAANNNNNSSTSPSGSMRHSTTGGGDEQYHLGEVSESSRQQEVRAFQLFTRLMKTGVTPNCCSPHDMKTLLHIAVEKDLTPVVLSLLDDFGANPEYTPEYTIVSSRSGLSTLATISHTPNKTLDSPLNLCMENPLTLMVLLRFASSPLERFLRHGSRILERLASAPNRRDLLDALFLKPTVTNIVDDANAPMEIQQQQQQPGEIPGLPLHPFVPALICGSPLPLSSDHISQLEGGGGGGKDPRDRKVTIPLSSSTKEFLVEYLPTESGILMACIEHIDLTDNFLLVALLTKLNAAFAIDNEKATLSAANSPNVSRQASRFAPYSAPGSFTESATASAARCLPHSEAQRNGADFASCVSSSTLAGGRGGPIRIATLEFDTAVKHILRRCVGDRYQIRASIRGEGRRNFHSYSDAPQLTDMQVRQLQSNEKGYDKTIQHLLDVFSKNVSGADVADEEKELNTTPM